VYSSDNDIEKCIYLHGNTVRIHKMLWVNQFLEVYHKIWRYIYRFTIRSIVLYVTKINAKAFVELLDH